MQSNVVQEPNIDEEIRERYHDFVAELPGVPFIGVLETHFEKGRIVRLKKHEVCAGTDPHWISPISQANLLEKHFEIVSRLIEDEFFGILESHFDNGGLFLIRKHQTFLGKDIMAFSRS